MTNKPFTHRSATALLLAAVALPATPLLAQEAAVAPPPVSMTAPPPVATPSVAPPPVVRTAPQIAPAPEVTTAAPTINRIESVPAERTRPTPRPAERRAEATRPAPRAPAPVAETAVPAAAPVVEAAPVAPVPVVVAPVAELPTAPVETTLPVAPAAGESSSLPWIIGGLIALIAVAALILFSRRRKPIEEARIAERPVPAPRITPLAPAHLNASVAPAAAVAAAHAPRPTMQSRFAGEAVDPYLAEIQRRRAGAQQEPVDPYLAELRRRPAPTGAPVDPWLAEIARRAPAHSSADPYLAAIRERGERKREVERTDVRGYRETVDA